MKTITITITITSAVCDYNHHIHQQYHLSAVSISKWGRILSGLANSSRPLHNHHCYDDDDDVGDDVYDDNDDDDYDL